MLALPLFCCRNEEGEEHFHKRRRQLPFHLSTGEGALYDTWTESFSLSGPPDSDATSVAKPTAEDCLDPASLLGSLQRQDHSVYSCAQNPNPQSFPQRPEGLDLQHPQSPLERAFRDSHALLSVPGQTQASEKRPVIGDLTEEAMIESLEQIMRDIGNGGMEGFEIEETELRGWENTLVRKNNERQDAVDDLSQMLANDVFSYVEEALMRETGGLLQGSGVPVSAHTLTPPQDSQPWPSGGRGPRCGEPVVPSQPESLQQSWHLPVEHANGVEQLNIKNAINTHRLQRSSSCRQRPPQGFPLAACPQVHGDSPASSHHLPTQQLWGGCRHGDQNGQMRNAGGAVAPVSMKWTLPGPTCTGGQPPAARTTPSCPFTLSHSHTPACPDVDNIGSLLLNGDDLEVAPSDHLNRNPSVQPSCCWQEEARVK